MDQNQSQNQKQRRGMINHKKFKDIAFVIALVAWVFNNVIVPNFLPHGFAEYVDYADRTQWGEVDPSNQSLMGKSQKLSKIYEKNKSDGDENSPPNVLLRGHETIVFDKYDQMYAVTEQSKLIKLSHIQLDGSSENNHNIPKLTAETTEVAHLGLGRPLGAKFDAHGNLYVADAIMGLIRVSFPEEKEQPKVELLASRVQLTDGTWSPILFADDVVIGPKTGYVYFTDATNVYTERVGKHAWDIMHASRLDGIQMGKSGRLLRYNPINGKVDILVAGIYFANGIAVTKDENMVVFAESFAARIMKYNLSGDRKGMLEVVADKLPGVPDGVDCSDTSGKCYAVIPSAKPSIMNVINALPPFLDVHFRTLLMMLPRSLAPEPKRIGCVVEVDPAKGKLLNVFLDPKGDDIADLHGVTVNNEKLYLGSLYNDYVGVYDLYNSVRVVDTTQHDEL